MFAYKVLRRDLTSLGLLGAARKQYYFDRWASPDEKISAHPRRGGGLWAAPTRGAARAMQRYVAKKHKIRTRIFRCKIGAVLHRTTCGIKTDRIFFSKADEVRS